MKDSRRVQPSTIRRITIDERLTESLIRVLVAELRTNFKEFDDDTSCWGEEKEILVQPDNFGTMMGMTPSDSKKWSWDSLYEGQTFLQGYFKVQPARRDKPRFLAGAKKRNFRCINDLIKENIKQIYFSALKGSAGNG